MKITVDKPALQQEQSITLRLHVRWYNNYIKNITIYNTKEHMFKIY